MSRNMFDGPQRLYLNSERAGGGYQAVKTHSAHQAFSEVRCNARGTISARSMLQFIAYGSTCRHGSAGSRKRPPAGPWQLADGLKAIKLATMKEKEGKLSIYSTLTLGYTSSSLYTA